MKNKELETWLKETKAKNLSRYDLEKYIVGHSTCPDDLYKSLRNEFKLKGGESLTDYLFNQWQKEAEFSPKRGDRVLADYKEKMIEIIDKKINKLETLKSLLIAEL